MQDHTRSGQQTDGQAATTASDAADINSADTELLVDEVLIEEISIDGMCGVY